MMRDLVLESRAGERDEKRVKVILPNIQGQKYVFGPFYPGGREGEEFILARNGERPADSTHSAIISVDDEGQYWIHNDTRTVERSSVCNTFVNGERVTAVEISRLQSGDVISLGDPNSQAGSGRHRIYCVNERTFGGSLLQTDSDSDSDIAANPSLMIFAESPLANNLILEKIMGYLPFEDLKSARLVCKKWKEEASKSLEKRGMVSFTFNHDYLNPENSTTVFRYLHEMRGLKMRNLDISFGTWNDQNTLLFTAQEFGDKMMDDLRKLLNSPHNFSTLHLQADIQEESDFLLFATIFQELGEKLVELNLETYRLFLPAVVPLFPLMTNLKKLTGESFEEEGELALASHLVPLFSNNLEHFTWDDTAVPYLEEFAKHPMPHLKGIELKETASGSIISSLLELETPLTFLKIKYCYTCSGPKELLERLLLKHSTSLQTLVISIEKSHFSNRNTQHKDPEVKFPSFPILEELDVEYGWRVKIGWETSLSYNHHFPALRKLTVRPRPRQPWSNDDPAFNAFFPDGGNLRCQTVEEVRIPVLRNLMHPCLWPYASEIASIQPRMGQIRNMFPAARNINFLQ